MFVSKASICINPSDDVNQLKLTESLIYEIAEVWTTRCDGIFLIALVASRQAPHALADIDQRSFPMGGSGQAAARTDAKKG